MQEDEVGCFLSLISVLCVCLIASFNEKGYKILLRNSAKLPSPQFGSITLGYPYLYPILVIEQDCIVI